MYIENPSKNNSEEGPYVVEGPYSGSMPLDQYTKARIGFIGKYSLNHLPPGMLAAAISLMPANDIRKLKGPYRNRFL